MFLALMLHPGSCDVINASNASMQQKRDAYDTRIKSIIDDPASSPADLLAATKEGLPTPPSRDALTWFAQLNISLPCSQRSCRRSSPGTRCSRMSSI